MVVIEWRSIENPVEWSVLMLSDGKKDGKVSSLLCRRQVSAITCCLCTESRTGHQQHINNDSGESKMKRKVRCGLSVPCIANSKQPLMPCFELLK